MHNPTKEMRKMSDTNLFSRVCTLGDFTSKRSSSWDRTGGNHDWIDVGPGETKVLLDETGAGCIRHFYWTYIMSIEARRNHLFRGLVLRAFWDGATTPSIEVPLGDFFGVANGQLRPIQSLAFTVNPGNNRCWMESWGFNCYLPMPFASGARIELENQGTEHPGGFWFHIDYEKYASPTAIPENMGRLHALWNREQKTEAVPLPEGQDEIKNLSGDENYTILDVTGDGQFAGYFLTVVNNERTWYGEGDDMIFIDGEAFPPSFHGTGTEEIFGGGACPDKEYSGPYTGYHCIENRAGYRWWGTNGMYRFMLLDPIRFRTSLRATIEHGHGNDKANDYCSCAFWYQRGVNNNLPKLPSLDKRLVNLQD